MKTTLVLGLALLAGCPATEDGGEMLPKPGEDPATDPTIQSVIARCRMYEPLDRMVIRLWVEATDPAGLNFQDTCAASLGTISDDDTFTDGCDLYLDHACNAGDRHLVDVTVTNDAGATTGALVNIEVLAN